MTLFNNNDKIFYSIKAIKFDRFCIKFRNVFIKQVHVIIDIKIYRNVLYGTNQTINTTLLYFTLNYSHNENSIEIIRTFNSLIYSATINYKKLFVDVIIRRSEIIWLPKELEIENS